MFWWKRKKLVANRGTVTVFYIGGLIFLGIVEFFSIIWILLFIGLVFPNIQSGNWPAWVEEFFLIHDFFGYSPWKRSLTCSCLKS